MMAYTREQVEASFPGGAWKSPVKCWMKSPLRPEERTASFEIDVEKGAYFDHGTGEGGKLSELFALTGQEDPFRREGAAYTAPHSQEAENLIAQRQKAREIWEQATGPDGHEYLSRKKVEAYGARRMPTVTTWSNKENRLKTWSADVLVVPSYAPDGSLIGVEQITGDGTKYALGSKGFHVLGELDPEHPVIVCEGYATAASVKVITGWNTVAAFGQANLEKAANAVRKLTQEIVAIAPDAQSADLSDTFDVVPFPDGYEKNDDWNDLCAKHGPEIVKQMFRDQWQNRRKKEKPSEKPKITISTMTALELRRSAIKPPTWIVPNILPQGLAVLAGRPKGGKSWLALKLALSVASGTEFLGNDCKSGKVLYAALEDTPYRLKSRIGKLWDDDRTVPADLHATTDIPRLDATGLPVLEAWVQEHRPRLIILDTWAKCKASGDSKKNAYEQDVEIASRIKKLADENECCILLLHHENKANANDQNWLNSLSGSLGLPATVDTILSLKREMGADEAVLKRAGRDLTDDSDLALEWTDEGWRYQGLAKETKCGKERLLILHSLRDAGEPVSVTYISADIGKTANATRSLLFKMVKGGLVARTSDGKYQIPQEGRFKDEDDDVTSVTDVSTVMPVTSVMPVMSVMQENITVEEGTVMPTVMQVKVSDTKALDEKHNDITHITPKRGNLEKFNLGSPSLAEKEAARREFQRLCDSGEEMDMATGQPMAEVTYFDPLADVRPEMIKNEHEPAVMKPVESTVLNIANTESTRAGVEPKSAPKRASYRELLGVTTNEDAPVS